MPPIKIQKPVKEYGGSDNEPLVSGYLKPVAVRVKLKVASLRQKVELADSGYICGSRTLQICSSRQKSSEHR